MFLCITFHRPQSLAQSKLVVEALWFDGGMSVPSSGNSAVGLSERLKLGGTLTDFLGLTVGGMVGLPVRK